MVLRFAFPSKRARRLDRCIPPWKVFIGSTRSFTLWRMSAIAFVYALIIGARMFIFTTPWLPQLKRARFREYINTVNALHENPRWYNAVTSNCTTSIRTQRAANLRKPWDWRIPLMEKRMKCFIRITPSRLEDCLSPNCKQRSMINERARAADQNPDFRALSGRVYRRAISKSRNNVPSSSFTLPQRSSIAI